MLNLLMVGILFSVFTFGLTKRLDKRLVRGIAMIMDLILGSTVGGSMGHMLVSIVDTLCAPLGPLAGPRRNPDW